MTTTYILASITRAEADQMVAASFVYGLLLMTFVLVIDTAIFNRYIKGHIKDNKSGKSDAANAAEAADEAMGEQSWTKAEGARAPGVSARCPLRSTWRGATGTWEASRGRSSESAGRDGDGRPQRPKCRHPAFVCGQLQAVQGRT